MSNTRHQTQRDSLLEIAGQLPAMKQAVEESTNNLRSLTRNYESTKSKNIALQNNFNEMQERFDILQKQNNALLNNSSSQVSNLNTQLSAREQQLDKREHQLKMMQEDLEQKKMALREVNDNYAEYEMQIQELQASIAKNRAQMSQLQSKIKNALKGFNAADLQVSERNGKIYVSLSQGLLFASGSDQIDSRGLEAISKIGKVLQKNPDIAINVEGHTDSEGTADKNWDLSVRRATSVVKRLVTSGCDGSQITASGRAFYDPLAKNDSPEHKAMNRRTEIIIAPKLSELMQLVGK